MLEKIGGRKVAVAAVLILAGIGVEVFTKNGLSGNLLELFKYVGGGFLVGNGLAHVSGAIASGKARQEISIPELDLSGLEEKLDALQATNGKTAEAVTTTQQTLQWIIQVSGIGQQK